MGDGTFLTRDPTTGRVAHVTKENESDHAERFEARLEQEAPRERAAATSTVHVLRQGLPLCGFSTEVPANWPPGHTWTHEDDCEHVTCPECLKLLS